VNFFNPSKTVTHKESEAMTVNDIENVKKPKRSEPKFIADNMLTDLQGKDLLAKQIKTGSSWLYAIAGLSLVNSVLYMAGSDIGFVVGLVITTSMDIIASELGIVGRVIALMFNVTISGGFFALAYFASKRHKWAFMVGLIIYALDTFLILPEKVWMGIIFHFLALFFIFKGYKAIGKLSNIENMTPEMESENTKTTEGEENYG
jgi:hypothetical protein